MAVACPREAIKAVHLSSQSPWPLNVHAWTSQLDSRTGRWLLLINGGLLDLKRYGVWYAPGEHLTGCRSKAVPR